jgi:DNA-binding IclR family transcriptional regulator
MLDKTLLKGLIVLETLAASPKPRGVSELARALEMSKTGTHRLLQTLMSRGYVAQDEDTQGYKLTVKLWGIGAQVISRLNIKNAGANHLQLVAKEVGESTHPTILDGDEIVYLDKIDGIHPLRTFAPIGGRAPVYCTATGKAMLAFKDEEYVAGLTLQPYTDHTIVTLPALKKELDHIRKQGYAVSREEYRSNNICGIGAPIFDAQGKVAGGIGISGPNDRLTPKTITKIGDFVREAADRISADIGYARP